MTNETGVATTAVLGVDVAVVNIESTLRLLAEALQKKQQGYVCFVSVHGLMESRERPALAASYRDAICCLPDGAPVAWVGRSQGETTMDRVAGPDLMLALLEDSAFHNATHFFYGGDPGVAELLKERMLERFPAIRVVGTFTPPFRELSDAEFGEVTALIHQCKPDILWVGLGCPKQEIFMHRVAKHWNVGLLMGVGAAFDFHTGRLKDSPEWVKRAGLQWFHRWLQEPRRLFKRYLTSNCAFLWAVLTERKSTQAPESDVVDNAPIQKPPSRLRFSLKGR